LCFLSRTLYFQGRGLASREQSRERERACLAACTIPIHELVRLPLPTPNGGQYAHVPSHTTKTRNISKSAPRLMICRVLAANTANLPARGEGPRRSRRHEAHRRPHASQHVDEQGERWRAQFVSCSIVMFHAACPPRPHRAHRTMRQEIRAMRSNMLSSSQTLEKSGMVGEKATITRNGWSGERLTTASPAAISP